MRTSRHSAYGEVCQLAQNLARNCGYAVFPCSERKTPTRRKEEGGQGHKDASTDPEIIEFFVASLARTADRRRHRRGIGPRGA